MSTTVPRTVTTWNKKLAEANSDFAYVDPQLGDDYEMPKDANVAVAVSVPVPESLSEAAGPDFYKTEAAALEALQNDTARVRCNAARPIIRETEVEDFDFVGNAQTAVDQYQPGRRGGFSPRVSEDEIEDIDDIEELKAFLKRRGAVAA